VASASHNRLLIASHTNGVVTPAFAQSYAMALAVLTGMKIDCSGALFMDSDVSRGRNRAVQATFDANYTHLLFADCDMEFTPADVLRLIAHDKDVCVGPYRKKNPRDEYNYEFIPSETGEVTVCGVTGCMEVMRAGTGFMLIKRTVFEQMRDAMPEIRHVERLASGEWRETCSWFEFQIRDTANGREQFSEDYNFCERWRSLGGRIWMDPTLKLGHYGAYCWQGDLTERFKDAA
jgi:hypothetical protein